MSSPGANVRKPILCLLQCKLMPATCPIGAFEFELQGVEWPQRCER